jgi:pyrroloquinoline quinone (PQQ) biosynthesis protein C
MAGNGAKHTAGAFEQKMAKVIWENRWKNFSAFDIWIDNHFCPEGAAVFAREHCVFARHFPRWFGAIISNCPEMEPRQYMIDNMFVEEVKDPAISTGHYESMVNFAVALGQSRKFINEYQGAIYTRMALAYWDRASRAWPWLESFAAVAGLEGARGPLVAKMGRTRPMSKEIWGRLGLKPKAMEHWEAAEEADLPEGGHGDMTLKILAKYADTAEKRARVLEVLEESMQVRWFHFDNIGKEAIAASPGAGRVRKAA